MKLHTGLLISFGLICTFSAGAQERGDWRASSKTAQSITGDVGFGNDKFTVNLTGFPMVQVRPLKPDEITSAFNDPAANTGTGHLFRLSIPGGKRFLNRNTLCGSEEVKWMATYVSGKQLQLAFFSNDAPPLLNAEALGNSSSLCGTYAYVR